MANTGNDIFSPSTDCVMGRIFYSSHSKSSFTSAPSPRPHHVVSAITIACKCTTSQLRSQIYLECMVAYILQLVQIHPRATVRPYHHLSMHLPHFFSLFGPARTFWTYPFERLIGQIQRLLSNHKLGESRQTLYESDQC